MEIRQNIIDRDYILETEMVSSRTLDGAELRMGPALFDVYHSFAVMPDVNGFVLSRMRSRQFSNRYTIDVLTASADATKEGFKDRNGRDLRAEVAKVVEPFIDATETDGEIRPIFGEFVAVGEIANPDRTKTPLKRAVRAYEDFAKKVNRGSDIQADIFVEKMPFVPMQELPEDVVRMASKDEISSIRIESTNRPITHSIMGGYRQLAVIPEVRGIALSSVKEANFFDIVVNSDTNPQEVQMAEASARAVITQLSEYMRNAGEKKTPKFGGLVEVPQGASFEEFKDRYLAFTGKNRRRIVTAAFYFPQ